jgi:predicted AAA+ superfamily ATPase
VSEPTIRRYLDLLSGVLMVRSLPPWHATLAKRQVKSPKVYLRDSGILHHLLGVETVRDLLAHPRCGASWEGYVIEEIFKEVRPDQAYFWATYQGAELDLLLWKSGRSYGIEVKRADAPHLTPSMRLALADLELERLVVLYPGSREYALADRVDAVPMHDFVAGGWRQWLRPAGRRGRKTRTPRNVSGEERLTQRSVTERVLASGGCPSAGSSCGRRPRPGRPPCCPRTDPG